MPTLRNIRKPVDSFIRHDDRIEFSSNDFSQFLTKGYVRFTTERRDILKVECPEMSVLDVTKKMADEWNNMPEENKKPYLEAAEEDKDR